MVAKWKQKPERVGVIVRAKNDIPGACFDPGVPAGTVGIVTRLNSEREPYVSFEFGEHTTLPECLLHWHWLEVVG